MIPPIIVMGVSGAGKSTLGKVLAVALGRPFLEGDEFHPPHNLAKMAGGEPLTDEDRLPFLDAIARAIRTAPRAPVVSCSALKRSYRDRLRTGAGPLLFILPVVGREALERRLAARQGHFMPATLLASQMETLELPRADECFLFVAGAHTVAGQLAEILDVLATHD